VTDRPPRPDPLQLEPEEIPEQLTERNQWVCWRYKFDTDRDEWTKVPVDVDGGFASSTDPDTWSSFSRALATHEEAGVDTDGLGFVVSDDDLVTGLDLDDCSDPTTGELDEWAEGYLQKHAWDDTAAEFTVADSAFRDVQVGQSISVEWTPDDIGPAEFVVSSTETDDVGRVTIGITGQTG